MTTLQVKLDLPDRLAREAQAAGLLTPKALRELFKDAMQRRLRLVARRPRRRNADGLLAAFVLSPCPGPRMARETCAC